MQLTKIHHYYIILSLILVIFIILSLSIGAIHIPLNKLLHFIQYHDSAIEHVLIQTVRIPRTLCAVLIGAALALTGVILFYITRNDLGCPSLLGINQGVFLGIMISVTLYHGIHMPLLLMSGILGGALAGLITFLLTFNLGFSSLKLILIGQAINLFCYAFCQLLFILSPEQTDLLLINLNGSLANSNWWHLQIFGVILVLSIITTFLFIKKNYLLSLSTDIAKNIGLNVNFYLALFLVILLIMTTCSVVIMGPLLFFPLLVVQCSKWLVSSSRPYHFALINALLGSLLLLGSDVLIRSYSDWEAPLNIFIAMLGVPLLIVCARKVKSSL